MAKIIKKKITIDEDIKKKIKLICDFAKVKPKFINGNIVRIDKTNLIYFEPHKVVINGINFLIFENNKEIFIENLNKSLKLNELEEYLKSL